MTPSTGILRSVRANDQRALHLHGKIPTWNDYVPPRLRRVLETQTMIPHIQSVKVPTLNVARLVGPGACYFLLFYGPRAALTRRSTQHDASKPQTILRCWHHGDHGRVVQ
jgi:hypothetical protein